MANAIKTGTTLIEEDALMPESLRFESEPWTPFYMAGEMIRESRKASGKQRKYASEGNTAHSHEETDRYNQPDCLPKDDPSVGTGVVGAAGCGDMLEPQMRIKSETQVIEEAEFKTFRCGRSITVPSLPTESLKGKTQRKHWPSRTRISSTSSAFACATVLDATGYSGIGRRLHLVGSPIL